MYYYQIDAKLASIDREVAQEESYVQILQTKEILFNQNDNDGAIFVVSTNGNKIVMGAIATNPGWLDERIPAFIDATEIDCCDIRVAEITLLSLKSLTSIGGNDGYIQDNSDIFSKFGVERLVNRCMLSYREHMLKKPPKKSSLIKRANDLLCADTLVPEIERIYQPTKETVSGHPVHYMIRSSNEYVCNTIFEILLSALYANGRIRNRRYCVARLNDENCREKEIPALYESCTGGAVVIKIGADDDGTVTPETRLLSAIFNSSDDEENGREKNWLDIICRTAMSYRDETLTIFCLPHDAEKAATIMREQLVSMTFVELAEDSLSGERAKAFLRQMARRREISVDKSLYRELEGEAKSFAPSELSRMFDIWCARQPIGRRFLSAISLMLSSARRARVRIRRAGDGKRAG